MLPIPSPTDDIWGPTPLPTWVRGFRPIQWEKALEVVEAFRTNDVVFLQAPTGTGKTLIAEMVRRLMYANAAYTCSTKALQDQFTKDFPYGEVLKGRSNYETESGALDQYGNVLGLGQESEVTCADCTYSPKSGECRWCSTRSLCPYVEAKSAARTARLAVLNTSYFLTDANKGEGAFRGRDLVILDEADLLEQELMSHCQLEITQSRMKKMGMEPPKRKTVEASWYEWVQREALPTTRDYLERLSKPWDNSTDARGIRAYYATNRLVAELEDLEATLPEGGWIYDGYDRGNVVFKPVKVTRYGAKYLWPHGRKFLLMSASILSHHSMAEELGLTRPYALVDVPGGYPPQNRPVHVVQLADVTRANEDTAWPKLVEGIKAILTLHPEDRVLIHTVSYKLAFYLHDKLRDLELDRDVVTYRTSEGKQQALADYLASPGAVLVAASMDRGIDLPGDACRVQVIAKVPWPSLGDKRVNARARMKQGQEWYRLQTIRTVIQMTGRGMRSSDDHVVTYVLDRQFMKLWSQQRLFPQWWREAVSWKYPRGRLLSLAKKV